MFEHLHLVEDGIAKPVRLHLLYSDQMFPQRKATPHVSFLFHIYDTLWASAIKPVPRWEESESGQMVSKKWNWPILTYIYHKQCEIKQKFN